MSIQSDELAQRTMLFAINVLRLADVLRNTASGQSIGRQLAQSATSVGAAYRACCNARSRAELIAKLEVVVEESEESVYSLDLIATTQSLPRAEVTALQSEARELHAVFAKSLGTARRNFKSSVESAHQMLK
jgi:four helix bundle protein